MCITLVYLKGKYHANLMLCQNPKKVCLRLSIETKKLLSSFAINYYPSAIKLSISASGQRQSRSEWTEKAYAFQVLAFLFPIRARTDHELFLSRIELISFLSLF